MCSWGSVGPRVAGSIGPSTVWTWAIARDATPSTASAGGRARALAVDGRFGRRFGRLVLPVHPADPGLGEIGVDGRPDRREERGLTELVDEAVALQAVLDRVLELGEAETRPLGLQGT